MLRVLERGQIETFAQRAIPRLRLPDRNSVFSARAQRLRRLGEEDAIGHSIADYLRLMATLADAQQAALASFEARLPGDEGVAQARAHGMPPIHATGWPREQQWRQVLGELCDRLVAQPDVPGGVREVLERLRRSPPEELERQAEVLLAARVREVDVTAAPFLVAALQVYWADLASRLPVDASDEVAVPGVCPMCGSLPVASVVRTDQHSEGFRYLHCALCATEWHMVRVTCSHCQATKGIVYQTIEGGPEAVRAECCDVCRSYRKIFYQEKDSHVEPVADDLASLTLDLL
ncbi:MAG: formate dehydrogenase accessory protein FdhE, partial [Steroidobacteraceae bacterium]